MKHPVYMIIQSVWDNTYTPFISETEHRKKRFRQK